MVSVGLRSLLKSSWSPSVSGGLRWYPVVFDCLRSLRWCPVFCGGLGWSPVVSGGLRWFPMVSVGLRSLRWSPLVSGGLRLSP